jgi:hypothetical protein
VTLSIFLDRVLVAQEVMVAATTQTPTPAGRIYLTPIKLRITEKTPRWLRLLRLAKKQLASPNLDWRNNTRFLTLWQMKH